jgi:transposase
MHERVSESVRSEHLDHHGIVAGICKDLGIQKKIDALIPTSSKRRIVSCGTAVVGMIINGLGFSNRRLYLSPQFFKNKPIDALFDNKNLYASDMNSEALGRALDEVADYGESRLFAQVSTEIALEQGMMGSLNHLDSTSFSLQGNYESAASEGVVEVVHGYSKDHRSDLKQVILSMVVNGPAALPVWMEALDGNRSDRESFLETIQKMERFRKEIHLKDPQRWVSDSALYSQKHLLANNDVLWLCRVPETLKEAQEWVATPAERLSWKEHQEGYLSTEGTSDYGGIPQRWVMIYSPQAAQRERATLQKKLIQEERSLEKDLWHLGNQLFNCQKDAQHAVDMFQKQHPFFQIETQLKEEKKHSKSGRPSAGKKAQVVGYRTQSTVTRQSSVIEAHLHSKGRFILACNDMNPLYQAEHFLTDYKNQQTVERGFRMLKDPWFMVDSFFLKSQRRIQALMMVMTLCLLVYNFAQYKLRTILKEQNETLPNQLKKQVQNPTLRWVFQIFEGIDVITFFDHDSYRTRRLVTNISPLRLKIINLLGGSIPHIYGMDHLLHGIAITGRPYVGTS